MLPGSTNSGIFFSCKLLMSKSYIIENLTSGGRPNKSGGGRNFFEKNKREGTLISDPRVMPK